MEQGHAIEEPMMVYAAFRRRLLATVVDGLVAVAIAQAGRRCLSWRSVEWAMAVQVFVFVFLWTYKIGLHARYGQTLGKMVARIRVTKMDGARIGLGRAALRSSVGVLLGIVGATGYIYALASWNGVAWSSLTPTEQGRFIAGHNPVHFIYRYAVLAWGWSEVIVLLTNSKRRALHDFIAGTVVILTDPFPSLRKPQCLKERSEEG